MVYKMSGPRKEKTCIRNLVAMISREHDAGFRHFVSSSKVVPDYFLARISDFLKSLLVGWQLLLYSTLYITALILLVSSLMLLTSALILFTVLYSVVATNDPCKMAHYCFTLNLLNGHTNGEL